MFLSCRLWCSQSEMNTEENKKFIQRLAQFTMQHGIVPSSQNAAVLVPFCKVNGDLSLLYTLRKLHLKTHQGQVSFPGGKQDPKDLSLQETALRETEEELGIPRCAVTIWGHGNMLIGKQFNILPVVGYIGDIVISDLKTNQSEVEFAFTIPLYHFYDSKNCKYTQFRNESSYTLPVYINAKCKVWGLTALITHIILYAYSPKYYHHKLNFIKI